MNAIGTKMITSEMVVASTARVISLVASIAARIGSYRFSSIYLTMFSSTTMASSITIPTASVSASSVMLLSVKSIAFNNVKVAIIDVGIAIEAMTTDLTLRIKNKTTSAASRLPNSKCSSRDAIDALMNTDWSLMILIVNPGGNDFSISAIFFFTSPMIFTVLVPDCRRT